MVQKSVETRLKEAFVQDLANRTERKRLYAQRKEAEERIKDCQTIIAQIDEQIAEMPARWGQSRFTDVCNEIFAEFETAE